MVIRPGSFKNASIAITVLILVLFWSQRLAANEFFYPAQVVTIEYNEERGRVELFDANYSSILNQGDLYQIYNAQKQPVATFSVLSRFMAGKRIFVEGRFQSSQQKLLPGMKIGLKKIQRELPALKEYKLPEGPYSSESYHPKDRSTMVLIDSGPFVYGSGIVGAVHFTSEVQYSRTQVQKLSAEKRIHFMQLPSFYIDKYEVTVGQFKKFLVESGATPPPGFDYERMNSLPIDRVSFSQAQQYCRWAGKRLPTELEWEKAARGSGLVSYIDKNENLVYRKNIRIYPHGIEFNAENCNTQESSKKTSLPVNELNDISPYGVVGMCGNVSEWTSSWFMPYRGNTMKNRWFGRRYKVIRGGAWDRPHRYAKAYERRPGGTPTLGEDYQAGFRCAADTPD